MNLCINPQCTRSENPEEHLFCQACGSELLLEGRYRVLKRRGRGGFGVTYEVSDGLQPNADQSAIKILKVLTENQPKHIELFQREAYLLSQLQHPGIPTVDNEAYFTWCPKNSSAPLHCIVMEKIVGLDLQDYLQQLGHPIDQRLALKWLPQIVEILQVLHHKHVLHRDIKPSNIMLKTDGHLALVDFGTARSVTNVSGSAGHQGTRVISSFYTPQEQMYGRAVAQSDFFALGRTFVYLLTAEELSHFYDAGTDTLEWHHAVPHLTSDFVAFLDALMMPAVNQRPASTTEILEQLQALRTNSRAMTDQGTVIAHAPTAFAPPVPPSRPPSAAPPPSSQATEVSAQVPPVDQQFIQRCQQELAEFIGPIAAIVCQRTLKKNPMASSRTFVEALAQQITNPEDAQQFLQKFN